MAKGYSFDALVKDTIKASIGGRITGGKLRLNDNVELALGNSDDMRLGHDGSNSYVNNFTGSLYLQAVNGSTFLTARGSVGVAVTGDSASTARGEIRYGGALRAYATSAGFSLPNDFKVNGESHHVGTMYLGADATAANQLAYNNGTTIFLGTSSKNLVTYKDLYTNSGNNKYWHAGNDGSGSGLDADLLDGAHASAFGKLASSQTWTGTNTFAGNPLIANNSPLLVMRDLDNTGAAQTGYISFKDKSNVERAWVGYGSGGNSDFTVLNTQGKVNLIGSGGVTVSGNKIWHAGNDGAGSSLDADTVDGKHATDFVEAGKVSRGFRNTKATGSTNLRWYRLASHSGGSPASALITVRATRSSNHSVVSFIAACSYGENPNISLLNNTQYGSMGIHKIRIEYTSTYDQYDIMVQSDADTILYEATNLVGFNEDWVADDTYDRNGVELNVAVAAMKMGSSGKVYSESSPVHTSSNFGKSQIDALGINATQLGGYNAALYGRLAATQTWTGDNTFSKQVTVSGSGKTLKFGPLNSTWCHFDTTANNGFYFYDHIEAQSLHTRANLSSAAAISAGTTLTVGGYANLNGGLKQDGHTILNGSDTWLRTKSSDGIYFSTHAGGLHMTDATWVRLYNDKRLYTGNTGIDAIKVAGGIQVAGTNQYGKGVTGLYSATRFQGVFSMGAAYQLGADGVSPGNLYGIAWTHSNNTNANARKISGHHACFMTNGVTKSAIGDHVWTSGTVYESGAALSSRYLGKTGTAANSNKLGNRALSDSATASSVAGRNSSGDIYARLFRSTYQNQSNISGAMAFRVNTSDNYIRFCSSTSAIRGWLSTYSKAESDARYANAGGWTLAWSGAETSAVNLSVDMSDKEVFIILSDVDSQDEIGSYFGYIPRVSGFSVPNFYMEFGSNDNMYYDYNVRDFRLNGSDMGFRKIYYRSRTMFPSVGTIAR